jgi:hypothetical protein
MWILMGSIFGIYIFCILGVLNNKMYSLELMKARDILDQNDNSTNKFLVHGLVDRTRSLYNDYIEMYYSVDKIKDVRYVPGLFAQHEYTNMHAIT